MVFSSAVFNGHKEHMSCGFCVAGSREYKGLNAVKLFLSFLGTWQWLSFSCFVRGETIPEFSLGLCWRGGRIQVIVSEAAVALQEYQQVLHPLAEKRGMLTRQVSDKTICM